MERVRSGEKNVEKELVHLSFNPFSTLLRMF